MGDVPFNAYDFFGYLACGALVVMLWDYIYGPQLIMQANHDFIDYAILLIGAYSAGHVISQLAERILQGAVVTRRLGQPTRVLMAETAVPGALRGFLFNSYFHPLPEFTRDRISKKVAANTGKMLTGEELFLHIFATVEDIEHVRNKLGTMLNLYGFARNMSLAALIGAAFCFIGPVDYRELEMLMWGVALLVLAIVFFYRYLKFFKLYSHTALISYSEQ